MRVKLVIKSTIEGATESNVITMTICTATLTCPASLVPSNPTVNRNGSPGFPGTTLFAPAGAGALAAGVAAGKADGACALAADVPRNRIEIPKTKSVRARRNFIWILSRHLPSETREDRSDRDKPPAKVFFLRRKRPPDTGGFRAAAVCRSRADECLAPRENPFDHAITSTRPRLRAAQRQERRPRRIPPPAYEPALPRLAYPWERSPDCRPPRMHSIESIRLRPIR